MKTSDAIRHFGSRSKVAEIAMVSRQAAAKWKRVIPLRTARYIEWRSDHAITVDPSCYTRRKSAKR